MFISQKTYTENIVLDV